MSFAPTAHQQAWGKGAETRRNTARAAITPAGFEGKDVGARVGSRRNLPERHVGVDRAQPRP
jgi:hypothetical protein